MSLFKPKILNAIDQIKQKKKRPDLNAIYEYLSKTEASNTDEQLIETIVEINIVVNRKTPKGFDSFQKLEVVVALVHPLDTDTTQANITRNAETQIFIQLEWRYSTGMHKHRYDKTS